MRLANSVFPTEIAKSGAPRHSQRFGADGLSWETMRRLPSHPLTNLPLKAHGLVADLSEVAVAASVERERQERGDHPIRNVDRPIHKARQPPLCLRIALPRRTELPHDLPARRAKSFARSFATATPTR